MPPTHVLVFIFDPFKQNVLLIRKARPDFMVGKLNGIGGKIEPNEAPIDAAKRELFEEAGLQLTHLVHVANFTNQSETFNIAVYSAETELFSTAYTKTDEAIMALPIVGIHQQNLVPSAYSLLSMCLEMDQTNFPYLFTEPS